MKNMKKSSKIKRGRPKLSLQTGSSRQLTINNFFGGQAIPHQSTVTDFFKVNNEAQVYEEVQLPSSSYQNHSPVIVKNEQTLKQLDNATLVHNSFVTRKIQCNHSEDLELRRDESSRKQPLSLKVRKRKYRTIVSPEKKSTTKCDLSSISTTFKQDGLSDSEINLLSMYSGYSCTPDSGHNHKQVCPSDLSSFEKKAHIVSPIPESTHPLNIHQTTSELSTPVKPSNLNPLPVSPTFSPRKNSLKRFSPFLESKDRSLQLDTSALLFSTPDDSNLSSVKQTPVFSRRKALFPKTKTDSQDDSSDVKKESDFGLLEDINLSDLLDESDLSNWSSSLTGQSESPSLCRYLVLEKVSQMSFNLERPKPEIMLRLFEEKTNIEDVCFLRDDWLTTDVQPGDIIQLNAEYDKSSSCFMIDNASHFSSIVVNPDTLISGTSVANSVTCVRRAVLSEKFKSQRSTGSEAMLIGQLLHEVFQHVLLRRKEVGPSLSEAKLSDVVIQEIRKVLMSIDTLDQLFCLEMSETSAHEILTKYTPAIVEWCDKYMHSEPVEGHGNIDHKMPGSEGGNISCVAITDIQDIEENIWSPRYGLKGKVDVSVTVKERRKSLTTETTRVPLELKTGKMFRTQGTIQHRAQVALYTLMLSDRYSAHPTGGLLYYMKTGHMQGLPSLPHEIRGLINARNHLSRYHTTSGDYMDMPGLLKDKHTCKYCPCLKECMLYHSTLEQGDELSSGVGELFTEQISHLSPSHLDFFVKWYGLVALEEAHSKAKDSTPLWLTDPLESEKEGCCHANLTANPADMSCPLSRQIQVFTQASCTQLGERRSESVLTINDRVVISRQDGRGWALTMGTITRPMCAGEMEVLVDKAVSASFLYRIDAAPSYGGGVMAGSLADFCTSDSERDQRLRNLIINLEPPSCNVQQSVKMDFSNEVQEILSTLNLSQKKAIFKVLSSQDFALILGMPGTGKTTTITSLVRLLVILGKSVLLTSYTHSAVDNILLKLKTNNVQFLRLGRLSRVHPEIHDFTPSNLCGHATTVQELEQLYLNTPVVATTCLGVKHPLFARRSFDVCIIDEASQITLPVSLGPLRYASMFVLVGDHYQLPPLVQSQQAREGGLDVSLFRYLSEHHPSALVSLELQYRMNSEIMSLSNKLIYSDSLKCGTEEVAQGRLHLPHLETHSFPSSDCSSCERLLSCSWLREVVDPCRPILFVNTDNCSNGQESIVGDHVCNVLEAELVASVVEVMLQLGLSPDRIGVITPMRYQQTLIQHNVTSLTSRGNLTDLKAIEVNTIDKYQGRDKECIILSFVRSNSKGNTGQLLKDWRRMNVAITRAKHKLILVGSVSTLKRTPLLECMLNHLVERKCLVHP